MKLSPMMQQAQAFKEAHPDCIIMFRLGDFYEMFNDDAVKASAILGLTLTGRDCGLEKRAPMCGVPYHAVDNYISKLIAAGEKVAICEQMNTPETAGKNKMLERDIVRIITPGTVIENDILEDNKSNFIASILFDGTNTGLSWIDVSTGEYNVVQFDGNGSLDRAIGFLSYVDPSEVKTSTATKQEIAFNKLEKQFTACTIDELSDSYFTFNAASKLLRAHFAVASLDIFDCGGKNAAIRAAGGLLQYLFDTQKNSLKHLQTLKYCHLSGYMVLDSNTKRNLELTESARDGKKKGSLFAVLNKCRTAMGARMLRNWIERPLRDPAKINLRLSAVERLVDDAPFSDEIAGLLAPIVDVERLLSKIAYKKIMPRDCLAISAFLGQIPKFKKLISGCKSKLLTTLASELDELKPLHTLLISAIESEECPATTKDGGYIRRGYSKELDEYRDAKKSATQWLARLETSEREKTGIRTLKTGYNRVFGYYIEVSNSFIDQVPETYIRKQTLTTGERYITPELKELEEKIVNAEAFALKIETEIYNEIVSVLTNCLLSLQENARRIAGIDALYSLSKVARDNRYVKPRIDEKVKSIKITAGRHPVVETLLKSNEYVTNDTNLGDDSCRTMVITGPNMAGKSTYMRQVALITLMAHMGSFVPANSAEISLTDRIFTRIGASDDLSLGQSTFMVEMIETATILKNATEKSLIVLDEIGRGTSTFDGLSIAWSVMEYVSNVLKSKTLFATHYHELTELEGLLESVHNYRVLVHERDDDIVFLYKIARGGANKSFGIEVSRLAGVPKEVTARAKDILRKLESSNLSQDTNSIMLDVIGGGKHEQMSLFESDETEKAKRILNAVRDIDVNAYSPMQALILLQDLVESAKK